MGLLSFSLVEKSHVFFRVGEDVLLCFENDAVKDQTTLPQHYGSGKLHFAFETSKFDYDAWREKVAGAGVEIEHDHVWPGGFRSCYFRDPDQHCVEILEEGMWEFRAQS